MAPPPSTRQITRDTLGDVPAWMDRLLVPLNQFLRQVSDALTNNLDSQNLAEAFMELQVTEAVAVTPFVAPLRGRVPKAVLVVKTSPLGTGGTPGTPPDGPVYVDWAPTTVEGKPGISISQVFGLATGAKYTITLLLKA